MIQSQSRLEVWWLLFWKDPNVSKFSAALRDKQNFFLNNLNNFVMMTKVEVLLKKSLS